MEIPLLKKIDKYSFIKSSNAINILINRGYLPEHHIVTFINMALPDHLLLLCEKCSRTPSVRKNYVTPETSPSPTGNGTVLEMPHMTIVGQFQNKERARRVNWQLLEIEKYAPEKWDTIETYLQGILDGVKPIKEKLKKNGQ